MNGVFLLPLFHTAATLLVFMKMEGMLESIRMGVQGPHKEFQKTVKYFLQHAPFYLNNRTD